MKGFKDYNWKVAKQMLVDVNFVKDLKGLNPDLIPGKAVNLIKAHMKVLRTKNIHTMRDQRHIISFMKFLGIFITI